MATGRGRALGAVCMTAGVAAGGAAFAHAQTDYFCQADGSYTAVLSGDSCEGAEHTLTGTWTEPEDQSNKTCAGAEDTNHNMYANWVCGTGGTYHCYNAGNLLYPEAHNHDTITFKLRGQEGYSGAPCPS